MIKRIIINILVVLSIVSISYSNSFSFIKYMPDFLLIVTVMNSIFFGPVFGMFFGFFAGLIYDFCGYPLIGFYSLIYCVVGYFISITDNKLDITPIFFSMIAIIILFLLKTALYTLLGFIFYKRYEISYYFKNTFLWQFLLTFIFAFPIYLIYNTNNNNNKKKKKRI